MQRVQALLLPDYPDVALAFNAFLPLVRPGAFRSSLANPLTPSAAYSPGIRYRPISQSSSVAQAGGERVSSPVDVHRSAELRSSPFLRRRRTRS